MKRKWIILAIVVLALGGFFIYKKSSGDVFEVDKVSTEKLVVVKTVSASGSVKSINEVDLALPATGTVKSLKYKVGDKVKEGDTLGALDNFDLYQNSQVSQNSLDVAKRDKELFIENYSTNLSGYGGEDEYKIALKRHDDIISVEEARYQSTLGTLTKTVLRAPFDGTIIDVGKVVGEVAVGGSSIIKLADLDNLIFEINLDQADFGFVQIGQKVEIVLDPYEDEKFTGTVLELPLFADETSEEFTVKIKVDQNENTPVLLGMKGDADIIINETSSEVTTLSFDQIFSQDEDHYIWIVENNKLVKFPVEIGLEGDIYTEVKTNLEGKEIVVPVAASEEITEGAKVKFKE